MLQGSSISLYVEVPEQLHDHLQTFLDTHRNWDVDQVVTIALARYLKSRERETLHRASNLTVRKHRSLARARASSFSSRLRRVLLLLKETLNVAVGKPDRKFSYYRIDF